jgi:hypothetical protein
MIGLDLRENRSLKKYTQGIDQVMLDVCILYNVYSIKQVTMKYDTRNGIKLPFYTSI